VERPLKAMEADVEFAHAELRLRVAHRTLQRRTREGIPVAVSKVVFRIDVADDARADGAHFHR